MNTSLPNDAALPQLALALDGAAMAQVFADLLRPHGMRVDACSVERIKYRPGRNATLAYRLQLRDAEQRPLAQVVAARLCGGEGARRAAHANAASLAASPAGPALRWLPALDMVTWWWPNDAKLRAPQVLACEQRLREQALPALLPVLGVPAGGDVGVDVEVVQYVPEQRLCARVDLTWHRAGATQRRRVYAKSSREPDSATVHQRLAQLQASAAWREGRLRTPRALLWHAGSELHWQEGLPGEPLQDAGAQAWADGAAPVGAQLAALHHTSVHGLPEVTRDGLHQQLNDVVARLGPVLGETAVRRAAQALAENWRALDGAVPVTLHGDFHARNILVERHAASMRASLIDLDGLRRGPALLELGAWIGDRMYLALLGGADVRRDEASWCTLIDAYVTAGGARPDVPALRWAAAWSLLTQRAWRCVINLKPGRFALAPRLVTLAGELVGVKEAQAC